MTAATIKTIAALVFFAMSWGTDDPLSSVMFFLAGVAWTFGALREARP